MKCPASVSVSTEAARNHSSSSIAATTDNVSSGSEQLRDGHLREPADGRRSYVRPSTGITIQSFTITNAQRLSQWKASSNGSRRPSRVSPAKLLTKDQARGITCGAPVSRHTRARQSEHQ